MRYEFTLRSFTSRDNFIVFLFVAVVILLSYLVFSEDGLRVFLSFITLIPLFVLFKSNIQPIHYSLALLFLSALGLALGNEKSAHQFGIYSYWLLVVAAAVFSIDYFKNRLRNGSKNANHH
jgi:hypothetical protein